MKRWISIPALREEGDLWLVDLIVDSTISIPALREEGDAVFVFTVFVDSLISIPALREEGDRATAGSSSSSFVFLSPPSARRATFRDRQVNGFDVISIPALREEGDAAGSLTTAT